jgi:nucleotide-binding universal stress UspA family protein
MLTFKKILVPTDFSSHAKEAAAMAIELAKRFDATLYFVHVFQSVAYVLPEGYMLYSAPQLGKILDDLDKLVTAEKTAAQTAGVSSVECDLVEGVPATEIVRYARDKGCDLIVIGTHGRTGVKHALLGSIAEKVMRTAECPVLTVRPKQ